MWFRFIVLCVYFVLASGTDDPFSGLCGKELNNIECPNKECCSQYGWCGVTKAHCGEGCQSNCDSLLPYLYNCIEPKMIAMTFDDGPSENWSPLFDILESLNVTATFFVIGEYIAKRKCELSQALVRGHDLGIHTWTHPYLTKLSDEKIALEIIETADSITNATNGYTPIYVRPPYLDIDKRVFNIIDKLGYEIVWVNLDTNDWKYARDGPQQIYVDIERALDEEWDTSYITLQHDMFLDSVKIVPNLVKLFRTKGYKLVSLDKCFGIQRGEKVKHIKNLRNEGLEPK